MSKSVGIVLQGDFQIGYTFKSISDYLVKTSCDICLSIWNRKYSENELEELKKISRNSRVEIVYSDHPNYPGYQNINYQLISSISGINKLSTDYIIKTRTDFFIDIEKLVSVLLKNQNKLLSVQTNCKYTKPFFISDFVIAGSRDDVISYFSSPLRLSGDNRLASKKIIKINSLIEERDYLDGNEIYNAERYLCQGFLKTKGIYFSSSLSKNIILWENVKGNFFEFLNYENIIIHSLKNYKYEKDIWIYKYVNNSLIRFIISYVYLKFKFLKSKLSIAKYLRD